MAATGMEVPWAQHMVERFVQVGEELLAVLSNGELWATLPDKASWHRILPDVDHVTCAATESEP